MMEAEFGRRYELFIDEKPVPKSTMPPPVIRRAKSARQRAYVQRKIIAEDEKYAPLQNTQAFQKLVADIVGYSPAFPQYSEEDPIRLTFTFYKAKHERGDLKNLEAATEDGVQFSGKIPDDGQVTSRGELQIYYYSERPGVLITTQIDPKAADLWWLTGFFHNSEKKALEYQRRRGIVKE